MKKTLTVMVAAAFIVACGAPATAGEQPTTGQVAQAEPAGAPAAFDGMPPKGTRAKCLVMGAEFIVGDDTASSTYKGKTYVFCCPGCKPQFDANPEKYVNPKA